MKMNIPVRSGHRASNCGQYPNERRTSWSSVRIELPFTKALPAVGIESPGRVFNGLIRPLAPTDDFNVVRKITCEHFECRCFSCSVYSKETEALSLLHTECQSVHCRFRVLRVPVENYREEVSLGQLII